MKPPTPRRTASGWLLVTTHVLGLAAAGPAAAWAQAAPTVQVWAAAGLATRGDAAVAVDASPPLLHGFVAEARLTADVPVPSRARPAIEVGASWFPTRHAGVEVWLASDSGATRVTDGSYRTRLAYVARFPPGSIPRDVTVEQEVPLPPLDVSVRRWSLGLAGALRWTGGGRVTGIVSAGACLVRASGRAAPLPLVAFWLGGHEVVFSETHPVTVRLGPASAWRLAAGGGLDTRMTRRLSLTTQVRVTRGTALELPLEATGLTSSGALMPLADDVVGRAMAASSARVPAASVRLMAGVKVRL